MDFGDPSMSLLAASGNDTVKLFDPSAEPADPCMLSYTPSPGCPVNSVKWNHTNLVVASAGEDKKISLWRKNGQSMGMIPVSGTDSGDGIEESILAINFSHKGSRYICSGGSGQVVRIWDLQRKRCIKWLRGHTDTITGAMYNCKDEHLASISLNGDLILHNLASGVKATELKDPNEQVLRVLDYSRISRHLLVTAGDDGSAHLWDTTGRSPKVSWLKQHSAPAVGIAFSPSNDKVIASIGMDKKLYFYDPGSKRPSSCIPYEAPFSSMAYREDGCVLAAGTSNGRVVFYDVRGKPQPYTVIRAYSSSEAVTSLCWQRSKPVVVNEKNCTAEAALLGGAVEDSILMLDPLPSVTSSSLSLSTTLPGLRNPGRPGSSAESYSLSTSSGGSISSMLYSSAADETPQRGHLWPGGRLSRLQAPRSNLNFKDDMEVFSPLVDVQPVTPSLDKLWEDREGMKRDLLAADKKPSSLLFPSSNRRFPFKEDGADDHPIFDWKSSLPSKQDDNCSSFTMIGSTPTPSSRSEDSSVTPPEAWGGEKISDKLNHLRQSVNFPSHFGMTSGSILSGSQDLTSHSSISSLANSSFTYANLRSKDPSVNQETTMAGSEHVPFSSTLSLTAKGLTTQSSLDVPGPTPLSMPRRLLTYAERIGMNPSFSDGTSLLTSSPKTKKTGAESREELLNSLLSRSDASGAADPGNLPVTNGTTTQSQKAIAQPDSQQGSSFTHQLFQCTLDETLGTFQKSIHEDLKNLHIEILRQFHIQEMETASIMKSILENQAELMKEVQSLRKENRHLRQLL